MIRKGLIGLGAALPALVSSCGAAVPTGHSEQADLLVQAPMSTVRAILLDPLRLPEWNSAFTSISGPDTPAAGHTYQIGVRGNLRGTFQYTAIGTDIITSQWTAGGSTEDNTWTLMQEGAAVRVTHSFVQRGALALLISGQVRGVATLRLERLKARAETQR